MGVSSKKINRRKQLEDGASCRKNNDCRDDLICARICRKLFVEGETCQNIDQCEGTLLCSRYTHQCTKPLKVGEDCAGKRDLCSAGLFCKNDRINGNNGRTCKAQLDLGDSCSGPGQCKFGLGCSFKSRV